MKCKKHDFKPFVACKKKASCLFCRKFFDKLKNLKKKKILNEK